MSKIISAYSGLNAFFDDSAKLDLLLLDTEHFTNIKREADADGLPVLSFDVKEDKGKGRAIGYRCNPAQLACLLAAEIAGASTFINYTNGKPYLKVCGQMCELAGITAARIFAGFEKGEDAIFRDGDPTNLTHANIGSRTNPRTERGRVETIAAILGQSEDKAAFERNKALLFRALDCVDAESDIASKLRRPDAEAAE